MPTDFFKGQNIYPPSSLVTVPDKKTVSFKDRRIPLFFRFMDSKMKLQKKTCLIAISQKNCTLSHKGMQSLQSFRSLPIPIKKSKRVLAAGLCTEEVSCSNSRRVARAFLDRFQRFGEISVNAGGRISTAINP
ncbi:hypothetical protein AVEN_50337-1 [Araneus ventricosus]|uniref:Uncharacterized protein n=1 Tax=Araneus ventricosus TaxID=182803 RepID=A0A4Y2E768_ARAVE|nr:hypothetical protein AVEN_50337-1 [Araneus ventricosus]